MATPAPNPPVSNACVKCGSALIANKPFCPACGTLNGAPPDVAAMQAYVDEKIAERVKDQASIVRELADKAEEVVWTRLKHYTRIIISCVFIILALLAFIGLKTYGDLRTSVVAQVQPAVIAVQQKVDALTTTLDDLQKKRIPSVTQSLNKVEGEALSQEKRVSEADGKILKSMASLRAAEQKATADSAAFSLSVLDNQKKLDQLTLRSTEHINQITASASNAAISQAYGYLDADPSMTAGAQTVSRKMKKTGEKWVDLNVSIDAIHHQIYTTAQLKKVEAALLAAGYRVFIGPVTVGGRFGIGMERLGALDPDQASDILYFDQGKKSEALQLQALVNTELPRRCGVRLLDSKSMDMSSIHSQATKYFGDNSGIDAQIFLGSVGSQQ